MLICWGIISPCSSLFGGWYVGSGGSDGLGLELTNSVSIVHKRDSLCVFDLFHCGVREWASEGVGEGGREGARGSDYSDY